MPVKWDDFSPVEEAPSGVDWNNFEPEPETDWSQFQPEAEAPEAPSLLRGPSELERSFGGFQAAPPFGSPEFSEQVQERGGTPTELIGTPFDSPGFNFGQPSPLDAQMTALRAEEIPMGLQLAGRGAAGLEKGMTMPERAIRGGLDLMGWYKALDGVLGTGTKFQDYNRSWLESFVNRDRRLDQESAALGESGVAGDVVESSARAVMELPVQLMGGAAGAARGAAMKGAALTAGTTGGLSQYAQDRGAGRGQAESALYGGMTGLITGLTTAAFGTTGVESIFRKEGVHGIARRIADVAKQGGMEGFEEVTDQIQQDLLERTARNPDKPIEQSVRESLNAFFTGTLVGGGVTGIAQATQAGAEQLESRGREPVEPTAPTDAEFIAGDKPTTISTPIDSSLVVPPELPVKPKEPVAVEPEKGTAPLPPDKVADSDLRVSVQSPMNLGTKEMPGYVQVDSMVGGENQWSSNPAALKKQGYEIPTEAELQKLPQGQYTMAEAKTKLEEISGQEATKIAEEIGITFDGGLPDQWSFTLVENGRRMTSITVKPGASVAEIRAKVEAARNNRGTDEHRAAAAKAADKAVEEFLAKQKEGGDKLSTEAVAVGEVGTGMGAATPAEFEPAKPFKTSNKNATVDAERKARGLPPMMDLERQTNQSAWDEAMRKVDENPQVQDELITELTAEPRAPNPVENAMLMHRRIDLRNEYEKSLHRWREMFEGDDMVRAAEEAQRVKGWSSKLADLEDLTKSTGAESGRSLQARKMMAREDFTLATMELAAMEAKGRNLTPQEHIELIKAQEKIADLQRQIDALESGREGKEVETQTTKTLKEVEREAKGEAKSKDFDVDREENLTGKIKGKLDKGEFDAVAPLVQQLARVLWRRGVRQRGPMIDQLHDILKTIDPDFTRDQTERAFSGYGKFTPISKAEIDVGLADLRRQEQQVLKMAAIEARKPLERTGRERYTDSDEVRRLIKQVNELKRKYGVVVTDPATQLKSALQSRKTYYEHRISDLKHEIETRERIVKTKSPSPTDAALDAMIAEKDRLQTEHDSIFPKREMTDEQRLKIAIAAAERNQAQWEVRLENAENKGIFDKRVPGRKVTSPELELIQAESAAIREHVKELKDFANPKKTKEEIALQSLKTRMATRIVDLKKRIATNDFAKRERKPVARDAEANRMQAELDIVKDEFNTKLEQDRWARMPVFEKGRRKVADTYDAARALMTTGELSFILRQGKLTALAHPIQTARALPDMFRALLANEQRAHEIDLAVHNHPDAPAARAAKLHLVEEGVSLHKQEEILMGRWVGKIPVVKNFNRAAQVFLNRIRFDTWQAMRKSMSKSGTPTLAEDRQIAMFVNEATGRGGLGKIEPAAVPLARAMFSPRYYASRLQLAAGHSLWGGTMRTRRIIATEYARSLVGLGLYYTLLSTLFTSGNEDDGEVEFDPRSTDFGKVKIGDTRLDPLAGLSQVIVLASRTATGEKKTNKGEVYPIRGEEVKFGGDKWSDIMARHLRGKLHPVPASIANLFDGTDLGGDEATVLNQAGNMVAPITYLDIYAALKEQDLDDGAALALLALLGEGLQTYKKRE